MLILRYVLEWPAAQVAELLGTTTTAVNSGLRRARAQLAQALPAEDELAEPAEPGQRAVLERFAAAFENADTGALAELLREDATLEMPPAPAWFAGRAPVLRFYAAHALDVPGRFRLVPVMANGQPAFAVYQRDSGGAYRADAVTVPTVTATGIARIVTFRNPGLFALFGLPLEYGAAAAGPAPTPAQDSAVPRGPAEQRAGTAGRGGRLCAGRCRDGHPGHAAAPYTATTIDLICCACTRKRIELLFTPNGG